jgi:hypothetical protein
MLAELNYRKNQSLSLPLEDKAEWRRSASYSPGDIDTIAGDPYSPPVDPASELV